MPNNCPVCGQVLPAAIDEQALHAKLEKLTSARTKAAVETERAKLKEEFDTKLISGKLQLIAKEGFEPKAMAVASGRR